MTTEEMYIRKIENGIRAIKLGSKTPEEAQVGLFLNRLKPLNEGMYQEHLKNYVKTKQAWDLKNK